ncbi:hypothetical protein PC41400_21690 [Paenibacillus chitinolyticus]|uniref:Uncharacterized protein n=1 Tax=Paenibacillus chitinolyticus TaxID=79263 RepID=A0A410X0A4_9BACL|nr:hypothetical protein [Paenibacillus chitinolyticus]MCY9593746.1 hypothetical protein [Paenibacillus chitinolyticus]MCY9599689.1 hypothetical protein [Paenibacillus chitinolyticus]QAV20135.1 hypothetical protein PC41400_21690 [Paenibacillus chitinolyticus]
MKAIQGFQIEDIDGCEFVQSTNIGKLMISHHQDFDGYYTGMIHVIYPDASHEAITREESQSMLDSGEWLVVR